MMPAALQRHDHGAARRYARASPEPKISRAFFIKWLRKTDGWIGLLGAVLGETVGVGTAIATTSLAVTLGVALFSM